MSLAESHAVGGGGREAASLLVGEETWLSQEKGGEGLASGLSRVELMVDEKTTLSSDCP